MACRDSLGIEKAVLSNTTLLGGSNRKPQGAATISTFSARFGPLRWIPLSDKQTPLSGTTKHIEGSVAPRHLRSKMLWKRLSATKGDQAPSGAIKHHQAPSGAIKRHQAPSSTIKRLQAPPSTLKRHQAPSSAAPTLNTATTRPSLIEKLSLAYDVSQSAHWLKQTFGVRQQLA